MRHVLAVSIAAVATLASAAAAKERNDVVLESEGSPLVSFRFVFHVGSSHDPEGKEGLAALTAQVVSQGGTKALSLREVMEALYPMAASVYSQPDKEVTTFVGRAHRDHLEAYYAVFRDLLLEPRFDPADFARSKDQVLNFLTKSLPSADDEELGKHALEWAMYESHPYRHPVEGTVESVRALTLDDVKAFYRSRYTFDALQIGLAGDFPDGFVSRVRGDFEKALTSEATSPTRELPELSKPSRGKGLAVTVVEKKAAEATAASLGFPIDITRADDDFYPLLLANIYLGDHRSFNGVLMNELRGKRGLNYGDYSYIENFIQAGGSTFPVPNVSRRQQHFSIWIRPVAPENAHFALRGALFYFRRLVEDGMSEESFEAMREYVRSYSKLWVQSLDRRLGYQLDSTFYGTGFYIDEIERRLESMTVEDVNRAVNKHLDRWDFTVAIVAADAESLAQAIESNAKSPVIYQTPGTAEEVLEEDGRIESLELPIESVKVVPVEALFQS